MPKIVKDAPVAYFPQPSKLVQRSFDAAMAKAREQNWDRVIIIGRGLGGSHMFQKGKFDAYNHDAIGMLEHAKKLIMDGEL